MKPRWAILFAVAAALAFAAVVLAAERAHRDASALRGGDATAGPAARFDGALLPKGIRVPSFRLRDENGHEVDERALLGRPVVITFLYTHCHDTCPITAQQVKGAMDDLRTPVTAIAFSVDPDHDTRRSARRFLTEVGMSGRLRFLLGTRDELAPIWRAFAIRPQLPNEEHQARLVLADARGYQRVGYPAQQATPERLAHDLRALGAS
ncbi:MAG: SCO family protein [Actinobacteria bacterium]|nr:SCO family protein [Actinomycetota bacterium]